MARGTPLFNFRLDPEIRRQLEKIAQETKMTISDLVRLAILDFIKAYDKSRLG